MLSQTQKTYIKSFPVASQSITLDLEGSVKVEEWGEAFIHIQAIVSRYSRMLGLKLLIAQLAKGTKGMFV